MKSTRYFVASTAKFSTGMKNQLEVTLALSQGADYILMDEPFSGSDLFNREDFYRVMLGLLSDHETVILSTHLLEEVKTFLSRAVLLRRGGSSETSPSRRWRTRIW